MGEVVHLDKMVNEEGNDLIFRLMKIVGNRLGSFNQNSFDYASSPKIKHYLTGPYNSVA